MAQAEPVYKKLRLRSFEVALLNALDPLADQSPLAVNAVWFLEASFQKSSEYLFVRALHHVRVEGFVFRTETSEHCGVNETAAHVRHGDYCQVIAQVFDRARSFSEFGADENSAAGSFLGIRGVGRNSNGAGVALSQRHTVHCHGHIVHYL